MFIRSWIPFGLVALLCVSFPAHAQEEGVGDAFNALPGVARVGVAGPVSKGITVSAFAGYGYSDAIIADEDTHHRGLGGIAASFRFVDWLAFSLSLDGRYDKHFKAFNGEGTDDGWVGNPRLFVRSGTLLSDRIKLGGQLGVWVPGESAPSIVFKAITLDFTAMGTYLLSKHFSINANVGFRLDQSAESVDNADQLSDADRISLGVSDSHAVLLGTGATYRLGKLELLGEWTWDLLVGGDRPKALESPMRITAGARYDLSRDFTVQLLAEVGLSKRPDVAATDPLVPIEPRLGVFAGVIYRTPYARRKPTTELPPPPKKKEPATLQVTVKTADGLVLPGAKIQIGDTQAVTDAAGQYTHKTQKAETITITASAENYKAKTETVTTVLGEVLDISFELQEVVPPGQLRGVVQSFGGQPLQATIEIVTINKVAKADVDGTFEIDVPPGEYDVVVRADGYAEQKRRIRIEREGVTLLNVDLRRAR